MRAKKSLKQMPHKRLFLLLGLGIASAALGASFALTRHEVGLKNTVRTPTVVTEIKEELENGKAVRFTNNGSADVFLRVSYGEAWHYNGGGAVTDADSKTENTANGDSDTANTASPEGEILSNMVTVAGDNGETQVVPAAQPKWLWAEATTPKGETSVAGLWQDGKDGWWYYKKVLPAKGGSAANMTGYILQSVDFSNVDSIADAALKEKYKSASYDLHFVIETVQASDEWQVSLDAIQALFGRQSAEEAGTGVKKQVSIVLDDLDSAGDAAAYWDKNKYSCTFQWVFE